MQVVLEMREKELEERQMEMAKILAALNSQKEKLQEIFNAEGKNNQEMEVLCSSESLEVEEIKSHRDFGIKLIGDAKNQERIIANTEAILKRKQQEVFEAHKKVEVLKKLKEKQEKEYYQEFLKAEMKEIDDITSARFRFQ
jgi:flagellar export protein FliJ